MKKISKVQVGSLASLEELIVWFEGSDEPFSIVEFEPESETRAVLDDLDSAIIDIIEIVNRFAESDN